MKKFLFVLLFLFAYKFPGKIYAQSIQISPTSGFLGDTVNLKIMASNVTFSNTSTTCPSQLKVTVSDVVLSQGSSTISPSAVTINSDGSLNAKFYLREFRGLSNVKVGTNSNCPVSCNNCFEFKSPWISVTNNRIRKGEKNILNIIGNNILFSTENTTECPNKLYVSSQNIFITNGVNILRPSSVNISESSIEAIFEPTLDFPHEYYSLKVGDVGNCTTIQNEALIYVEAAPRIEVSPNIAKTGESLSVTITGSDISFEQGSSTLGACNVTDLFLQNSTGSILPSKIETISSTKAIANFVFPIGVEGIYDVVGENFSKTCIVKCNNCFTINEGIDTVPRFTLSANRAKAGDSIDLTIYSKNFVFGASNQCPGIINPSANDIVFNQGQFKFSASQIISKSENALTIRVKIPENAFTAQFNVIINSCSINHSTPFYIYTPNYNALYITRNEGAQGESIYTEINGSNIKFTTDVNKSCPDFLRVNTGNIKLRKGNYFIAPTDVNISYWNPAIVGVNLKIPAQAEKGKYDLMVGEGEECEAICLECFEVVQPSIYLSRATISENQYLTIYGKGVNFIASSTICPSDFNLDKSNVAFKNSDTTIYPSYLSKYNYGLEVSLPSNAPLGKYDVIVGSKENCPIVCAGCLEVKSNKPYITRVYPEKANRGVTLKVRITAENIIFNQASGTFNSPCKFSKDNILFIRDSVLIRPTEASHSYNFIDATITIPDNSPLGNYQIIANDSMACQLKCDTCFSVQVIEPRLYSYNYGMRGAIANVQLSGNNISYVQKTTTVCPGKVNMDTSSFVLRKDNYLIKSDSISEAYHYVYGDNYKNSSIMGKFFIPKDVPSGRYDIIAGYGGECPAVCKECFTVTCDSFPDNNIQISGPDTLCIGAAAIFTLPKVAGVEYTWNFYYSNGWLDNYKSDTLKYTFDQPGYYNLWVQPSNNCGEWEGRQKTIIVKSAPNAQQLVVLGDTVACTGVTQDFIFDNWDSNSKINWRIEGDAILKDSLNIARVTFENSGLVNLSLAVENFCGIGEEKIITVQVGEYSSKPSIYRNPQNYIEFISTNPTGNQWYRNGVKIEGATQQSLIASNYLNDSYSESFYKQSFYVEVTDDCGKNISNSLYYEIVLGDQDEVVESEELKASIFPNPAQNECSIKLSQKQLEEKPFFHLYDSRGQKVMNGEVSSTEMDLDLSTFTSGLYFLEINSGKKVERLKLVIQK